MRMLLLFAVLLASLLEPVAAASPIMDNAMPGPALEQYNADFEGILCNLCAIPFYQCIHAMPQAPYVAAQMLYVPSQPLSTPIADPYQTETDLEPLFDFVAKEQRQPLLNSNVRYMDEEGTTVQPATILAHIKDIYTPGDRLQTGRPRSRRSPQRRQAPRPGGGYPCNAEGCDRTFDRACELNRHQKTHLNRSERPHKCSICNEGFLYPKDLHRHERKHVQQPADQVTFFCPYPNCDNLGGFSRRDNLLRHQRKQHASIVSVA